MLDKTYRPGEVEEKHYLAWEAAGTFACGQHPDADPYTIVIPPPNVTGSLHMGHALNNTLQDILIRYQRMKGADALWQPGTDHAGIATQMVVERQMADEGQTRHDLGRENFIKRVWEWKAESGGTITGQLRRIGASCDWGRERFTMDEGLSKAVRKVFPIRSLYLSSSGWTAMATSPRRNKRPKPRPRMFMEKKWSWNGIPMFWTPGFRRRFGRFRLSAGRTRRRK